MATEPVSIRVDSEMKDGFKGIVSEFESSSDFARWVVQAYNTKKLSDKSKSFSVDAADLQRNLTKIFGIFNNSIERTDSIIRENEDKWTEMLSVKEEIIKKREEEIVQLTNQVSEVKKELEEQVSKINQLMSEYQELEADYEQLLDDHKQLKDLNAMYKAKEDKYKESCSIIEGLEKEIEDNKAIYNSNINTIEEMRATEIASIKREHKEIVDDITAKMNILKDTLAEHNNTILHKDFEIEKLKKQYSDVLNKNNEDIESIRANHKLELEKIELKHGIEIEKLQMEVTRAKLDADVKSNDKVEKLLRELQSLTTTKNDK